MNNHHKIRSLIAFLALTLFLASVCGDAFASEPRRIVFAEAVEIALEQNTSVQRVKNQTALARTAVTRAELKFLPTLALGLSGGTSFAEASSDRIDDGTSLNASLSSRVTLFDGFANIANVRQARDQLDAAELDEERAAQTVVFDVIHGFLAVIEAGEQASVREENLLAQERQEAYVQALVEGGERPISDLYQQQANVAAARLFAVETKRTLDLARIDLVQALQLDPAGEYVFEIPPLPESVATEIESLDPAALIQRAFAERADLQAAALEQDAAGEGVRMAKAGRWPSLSLSAGYGTGFETGSEVDWQDQFDERRSGSLSLSVSLPLFDGLALLQAIRQAQTQVASARLSLADLRQEVALQVRRAVLDRDAAVEQLRASVAQERAARQALEATQERYSAGSATLYEVTLARADFTSAESARIRARYNLLFQDRLLDYYIGDLRTDGPLI